MRGDVSNRDFPVKEKLKILHDEGFWWLQGQEGDAFVSVLQCLAPLQSAKAGITTKDNPMNDCNEWVGQGQGGDVLGHPQGHFVGDHNAAFGD